MWRHLWMTDRDYSENDSWEVSEQRMSWSVPTSAQRRTARRTANWRVRIVIIIIIIIIILSCCHVLSCNVSCNNRLIYTVNGGSVVHWLGRCTRDIRSRVQFPAMTLSVIWDMWPYFSGELSWDITTAQVNSACIPPGSLNRVPASAGVKAGKSPLRDGR